MEPIRHGWSTFGSALSPAFLFGPSCVELAVLYIYAGVDAAAAEPGSDPDGCTSVQV